MNTVMLSQAQVEVSGMFTRLQLNKEAIEDYTEVLRGGGRLPPLTTFFDGEKYWLGDGFHRLAAHAKVMKSTYDKVIECEVREGTQREALLYALGANDTHGVRRTNGDKRNCVYIMLTDPEWAQWSDREIARRCRVSNDLVSRMRRERSSLSSNDSESAAEIRSEDHPIAPSPPPPAERTYVTKHGTVATMATSNIGTKKPAPETTTQDEEDLGDQDETEKPSFRDDILTRFRFQVDKDGRVIQAERKPDMIAAMVIIEGRVKAVELHTHVIEEASVCEQAVLESLLQEAIRSLKSAR